MLETLHLLFVLFCLSRGSAGSFFNLKAWPGLVWNACYRLSLSPSAQTLLLSTLLPVRQSARDAENYNSHSHSSLHRHKALHRFYFNFSPHCIRCSDLWSKIKSWLPNPYKSNNIQGVLVHEVASWQQTRGQLVVEMTVAWISLKSPHDQENWPRKLTLPKP